MSSLLTPASAYLNNKLPSVELQPVGIGDFTLLARVNESYSYESDAPTTFLEDGESANDHIVLKPLVLQVSGMVSDIFITPTPSQVALRRARAQLGVVTPYLPGQTQAQIQRANAIIEDAVNQIQRLDQLIADGKQVASFLQDQTLSKTIQEQFVEKVESWHSSRSLIKIEMPFRTFENMRILTTRISRDNEVDALSFEIQAQQLRFAETPVVAVNQPAPASSLDGQTKGPQKKAAQKPETSLLSGFVSAVRGS